MKKTVIRLPLIAASLIPATALGGGTYEGECRSFDYKADVLPLDMIDPLQSSVQRGVAIALKYHGSDKRPRHNADTILAAGAKERFMALLPESRRQDFKSDEGPGYHWSQSSDRCQTQRYSAALALVDAFRNSPSKPSANDTKTLTVARSRLLNLCTGEGLEKPEEILKQLEADIVKIDKPAGFDDYLRGAYHFYVGDDDNALKYFGKLAEINEIPWLRDTSAYMLTRISRDVHNGPPPHYGLTPHYSYLATHPQGLYRKSVWHSLRQSKSAEETSNQLAKALEDLTYSVEDLERIIYDGIYAVNISHPLVFLAKDLFHPYLYEKDQQKASARTDSLPNRYDQLTILGRLYTLISDSRYTEALAISTKALAAGNKPVRRELQIMRFRALLGEERFDEAEKTLASTDLSGKNLEKVRVALHNVLDMHRKQTPQVLTRNGSSKADISLALEIYLTTSEISDALGKKLLPEQPATKRLVHLLASEGQFGRLGELLQTSEIARKELAPITTAIATLRKNPADAKALLNIGYYLQVKRAYAYPTECNYGAVNWTNLYRNDQPSDFRSPLQYYKLALEKNKGQDADLEAKILYHLVRCFRGSEPALGCHWERHDVPVEKRKEWFTTLQARYAKSSWAKSTGHYW